MKSRSYKFGNSRLTIEFGDITAAGSDVIVSSDDYYITMGGGVSAAVLRAGGQEIMIDAAKKVPAKLGDVVVTTAERLKAQYIFHEITLEQYADQTPASQIVRKCVARCFDLLDALGLDSVAFPAVGAGAAQFSYEDVAVEMADVIADRLVRSERSLQVTLFLFDRFGRMQPIDFVQFFEEFARRVPKIAEHEVTGRDYSTVQQPVGVASKKPTEPVARRQEARLQLNELTEERTDIEDQLARMNGWEHDESKRLRARLDLIASARIRILSALQQARTIPVSVFISYSHKDQSLREELQKHLSILKRQGAIETWHDRQISAGSEWQGVIDEHLMSARLILLLVSPDFMASDYCYETEMERALQRHESGEATIVPIILRQVMWDAAPFAKLQALPTDGKAVTTWENVDAAFDAVARGIRATVESINAKANATSA